MLGYKKLLLEGSISPSGKRMYFPLEILEKTGLKNNQYYEILTKEPNIILLKPVNEKGYGVYKLCFGYRKGKPYFASITSVKLLRLLKTFFNLDDNKKIYFILSTKGKVIKLELKR